MAAKGPEKLRAAPPGCSGSSALRPWQPVELPSVDIVAMAVFVAAALEPLDDINQRAVSLGGEQAACICRAAADTADDIDRRGRIDYCLHLLKKFRVGPSGFIGNGGEKRFLADLRQVGRAGKMPLGRRTAVNQDGVALLRELLLGFKRVQFTKHGFPFFLRSGSLKRQKDTI